jgi:hypothetical protein
VGWAEIIKARDEGIQQRRQSLAPDEFSTGFEVYQPDEQEWMQARSLLKSAAPDDMGRMDLSKTGQLMDAINRGTIAGTLGAPADIGNEIMRPFGYGQEKPFLGSEWFGDKMQSAGMVSANRNPLTEGIAGFIDPLSALAGAAKVPLMFAHTVYHGSPHTFDAFDASKIGTGEGAQAYGHGTYYAESPDVAKSYAPRDFKYEDKLMKMYKQAEAREDYASMQVLEEYMLHKTPQEVLASLPDYGYEGRELRGATSTHKKAAKLYEGSSSNLYKADIPDEWLPKMLDWDKPLSEQGEEVRKALSNFGETPEDIKGAIELYKPRVNLPGIRGENAKKELARLEMMLLQAEDRSGAEFYRRFGDNGTAAERLRDAGIPGIRYEDGGSRGKWDHVPIPDDRRQLITDRALQIQKELIPSAKTGEEYKALNDELQALTSELSKADAHPKTYNYVIFPGNEGKVKILERNGRELLAQRPEVEGGLNKVNLKDVPGFGQDRDIEYITNPKKNELERYLQTKKMEYQEKGWNTESPIRYIVDDKTGDAHFFDANELMHQDMADALGISKLDQGFVKNKNQIGYLYSDPSFKDRYPGWSKRIGENVR